MSINRIPQVKWFQNRGSVPLYMFTSDGRSNLPPALHPSFKRFVSVETPGGIIIHGHSLHEENGRVWIEPPMQIYKTPFDEAGLWLPSITFATPADAARFRRQILAPLAWWAKQDRRRFEREILSQVGGTEGQL